MIVKLERLPLFFQIVGKTTMMLNQLNEGDAILDFIGPLGKASELEGYQHVAVIGGGAGYCNCISASQSTACYGYYCGYDCRFPQYRFNHFGR